MRIQLDGIEHFGDVAHALGELVRAVRPFGIAGEEFAVAFERGTAARGVDDVDVGAGALEGGDVAFGELAPEIHLTGVNGDRAATALVARDDAGESAATQHAQRTLRARSEMRPA